MEIQNNILNLRKNSTSSPRGDAAIMLLIQLNILKWPTISALVAKLDEKALT